MRREFEHYLDNLEAARALIKPYYPNDLGKNALIIMKGPMTLHRLSLTF